MGTSREEGVCWAQSSWFTKVSGALGVLCVVLRGDAGLKADLRGTYLVTWVTPLSLGPVLAAEPKDCFG